MHGKDDDIIPPSHSEKLYETAKLSDIHNVRLELLEGCDHNNMNLSKIVHTIIDVFKWQFKNCDALFVKQKKDKDKEKNNNHTTVNTNSATTPSDKDEQLLTKTKTIDRDLSAKHYFNEMYFDFNESQFMGFIPDYAWLKPKENNDTNNNNNSQNNSQTNLLQNKDSQNSGGGGSVGSGGAHGGGGVTVHANKQYHAPNQFYSQNFRTNNFR